MNQTRDGANRPAVLVSCLHHSAHHATRLGEEGLHPRQLRPLLSAECGALSGVPYAVYFESVPAATARSFGKRYFPIVY